MADEIQVIEVTGEVVRLGDTYPLPIEHHNEDGTSVEVIYLDVRADSRRYKVQLRGSRTLAAFANREFFHHITEEWFLFDPPDIGDWVQVKGSYSLKEPTEKFDRYQHQLIVWEPWNIRQKAETKRPSKKKMAAW